MRRLLILFCFWFCHSSASVAALRLAPTISSVALGADVSILEDAGGGLSLADVKNRGGDFRPLKLRGDTALNLGYSSSAWWLRFEVESAPGVPRDWVLEVAFPTLDRVEYFGPEGEHFSTGDHLPFASRPLLHRNFVFPLHLAEAGASTVWLRVASEGTLILPLHLWRAETFWQESGRSYFVLALYFGISLALALHNLLLWISRRDLAYLTYALFVGSMAIGQLALTGLGNQFLWSNWPQWGNLSFAAGFAAAGLFGALFTRSFLQTRRNLPHVDGAVSGLAALFAVCIAMSVFAPYRLAAILTALTGVALSFVAVLAGLRGWRAGHAGARSFLLAWVVSLIGVAILGLHQANLLPITPLSFDAMLIGSALGVLLLSFALGDRVDALRREKDAAQDEALAAKMQLVRTLQRSETTYERRVAQRTEELEAANARLRENERQLQMLVHSDPLTGLANRLLFDARLLQTMQQARRNRGRMALLLVDVDHFKAINDRYGHAIGDEVLRCTANRFRATMREVDTVARLGSDEFAIALSGLGSGADTDHMAQKILTNLCEPMRLLGLPLEVTVSIGIAHFSSGDLSPLELLRRADQAMHAAKRAGRGCYRVFA